MKRFAFGLFLLWIIACGLVAYLGIRLAEKPGAELMASVVKPEPDLATGNALYEQHCARCHGIEGRGDGYQAKILPDDPRNFTAGFFEYRSTASGTPPTDEDLFRIVSNGIPPAGMPAFGGLSEESRWQLVHYVKQFSTAFQETAPELVDLGNPPAQTNLVRGQQLYAELGCAACHGPFGRANGPSAATLVDNEGHPIAPVDLTKGWTYHGGSEPRATALRLVTGIDGTPMPSYKDAISIEEAWHLASYVHALQEPPHWQETFVSQEAEGELPSSPTDPAWDAVPPTDVRLASVIYEGGHLVPTTVNAVRVQAVHNHDTLVVRLVWHDPSESRVPPADAVVLAFSAEPAPWATLGNFQTWAVREPGAPLDLCYWSADQGQAIERVATQLSDLESGHQALASAAMYDDGRWIVVIKRPLRAPLEGAVALEPQRLQPVALAAWDGGHGEHGHQRAVSSWLTVSLGQPAEPTRQAATHQGH